MYQRLFHVIHAKEQELNLAQLPPHAQLVPELEKLGLSKASLQLKEPAPHVLVKDR